MGTMMRRNFSIFKQTPEQTWSTDKEGRKNFTESIARDANQELRNISHSFFNSCIDIAGTTVAGALFYLYQKYDVAIMVGGSGLYADAVVKGLDNFPEIDSNIRETLNKQLASEGLESLQEQLKVLDIQSYNTIAINNPHRVIRALEICIGTNQPYSSFLNKEKSERPFNIISIGLTANRPIIYDRINQRVDQMMANGLLDEVKQLQSQQHLNALNTVGYSELFKYLNGEWTLEFAISEIKKNSRRFAKRQLTWFKKDPNITWFEFSDTLAHIIQHIEQKRVED